MWKLLEKLRQKPEPQKVMIAFVASLAITIIIVAIWLPTVLNKKEEIKKPKEEINLAKEVTPLANIGSQISEIKNIWNEGVGQLKKINQDTEFEIESSVQ